MKIVAIVGVGLIGGSFGLALREAGFEGEILGVSSPEAIEAALEAGAISRSATLEEAAETADLLYLAQPVDRILSTLATLSPLVRDNCLVTDAGSTKVAITREAIAHLPPATFLGGHPLAGKESRGAQSAQADLFRGKPYVLTRSASESGISPAEQEFADWLTRIGAFVLHMTPEEHDATVAFTSHLPQLVSTVLAATLASEDNPYLLAVFGPGLTDMTRLAMSSLDLWRSILSTNKAEVTVALDLFIQHIIRLRNSVQTDDLGEWFGSASTFAAKLRK